MNDGTPELPEAETALNPDREIWKPWKKILKKKRKGRKIELPMPPRKVILWLTLLCPAVSRFFQSDPSRVQLVNSCSQLWPAAGPDISISGLGSFTACHLWFCLSCGGCGAGWRRVMQQLLPSSVELRGLADGSQAGRAPGPSPNTCGWSETTHSCQPQGLCPCLGRPGRPEQIWDVLLATITRPPSAAKPGKCFCSLKNEHQIWLFYCLVFSFVHELA